MSRAYRSDSSGGEWRPTAGVDTLRLRARILSKIRSFFDGRGLFEVETPLLSAATASDPHIESLSTRYTGPGASRGRVLYLQTSPEFAMKRLLAAGTGPIYQIGKAFRNGEAGRLHNPEFTLLEWYRPGFDHHALMDEMNDLLRDVVGLPTAERRSYGELFREHIGLDPHRASLEELYGKARDLGLAAPEIDDEDDWLSLFMTHIIEPGLGKGGPTFVYDYPVGQAALARVRGGDPPVAERFEVYVEGLELANGFHELTDAVEQGRRFAMDIERRRALGAGEAPVDERLLAALEAGLPSCAGVALGVDRLVMIAAGTRALADVITFPIDRA